MKDILKKLVKEIRKKQNFNMNKVPERVLAVTGYAQYSLGMGNVFVKTGPNQKKTFWIIHFGDDSKLPVLVYKVATQQWFLSTDPKINLEDLPELKNYDEIDNIIKSWKDYYNNTWKNN